MEDIINTFKNKLEEYIPKSYEFSGIKEKELSKKIKSYKKRYDNIQNVENPEIVNYVPHCIFDLLFLAENDKIDNKWHKQFLYHVDEVVTQLISKVDNLLLDKLRATIKQIILTLDEKLGNNYQYLNFYGEILGLDFFIAQNARLKLIDIERKLPNGKHVDFVFQSDGDNLPLYVEFVNFHNIKPELLETEEEFIAFFEDRYNKKLEDKTNELTSENNKIIIGDEKIPFIIQPILWGDIKQFMSHEKTIKKMDEKYFNISKLASLFVQIDKQEKIHYSFMSVTNILDRIIEDNK